MNSPWTSVLSSLNLIYILRMSRTLNFLCLIDGLCFGSAIHICFTVMANFPWISWVGRALAGPAAGWAGRCIHPREAYWPSPSTSGCLTAIILSRINLIRMLHRECLGSVAEPVHFWLAPVYFFTGSSSYTVKSRVSNITFILNNILPSLLEKRHLHSRIFYYLILEQTKKISFRISSVFIYGGAGAGLSHRLRLRP